MDARTLTVKRLFFFTGTGAAGITAAFLLAVYHITGSGAALLLGLAYSLAMTGLIALILLLLRKKLTVFSQALCQTIDRMMNGAEELSRSYEQETLLSRVEYRLSRFLSQTQNTRQTLDENRRALQEVVSDISHQVKTPIANLKLISEALMAPGLHAEQRRAFLESMTGQLDKLDFLMQSMIKLSRLETGVLALTPVDGTIYETVASALGAVFLQAEAKGLHVTVDCDQSLRVPHDAKWTVEALFNVLDNAIKYTEPGGRIGIDVSSGEMYLKIAVADTGRGIPEELHGEIFHRFFRQREVAHIEGIGIGLYLTRKIITLQGGYVVVNSAPGKGSVFSLYLPRHL